MKTLNSSLNQWKSNNDDNVKFSTLVALVKTILLKNRNGKTGQSLYPRLALCGF